ncbi:hypothetical protein GCM10007898_31640 [Dyella flagellata]|uniref:MobA/MobL protein domain-containing protein n=1 Tax=Dyella flagellata TaxID=1867833 RepID=A0ABQ5XEG6_9GAMM|nr:hypothetical protein GCM10007898_31640 [Dyella flagellata]
MAAAAYRAGVKLEDQRTAQVFDFTRRSGVVATTILAPADASQFARDRASLWNAAEAAEKRKDARTAREWVLALPSELGAEERADLARDFAGVLVERFGVAVDVAIHAPSRGGDDRNHHAHLLCTTRMIGSDGLGEKCALELSDTKRKTLGLDSAADEIAALRERWTVLANAALEKAGSAARIDHRSLLAQQDAAFERGDLAEAIALDRPAQVHIGVHATQMDRRAGQIVSRRGRMHERAVALARHVVNSAARWAHGLIDAMRPEAEALECAEISRVQVADPGPDTANDMPASAASRPANGIDLGAERRRREDAEKQKRKDENPLADLIQKWRTRAGDARSKPDESTQKKEKAKMARPNEGVADASRQSQPQHRQERDRDGGPEVKG